VARISERLRVSRRISRRISAITESATLAVDAKAKAMRAAGEDVIGFGAGEPDFPTPEHVVEAAIAACRDPVCHHYTPAAGLPELRAAIAAKTQRDSNLDCSANQVLVTNGGKQAVYNAFQVLLDPGDEVLLPAPYWTTYPEAIALADGVPVALSTGEETTFRVSVEQLEAARTMQTKALLFCSPSNPTGVVYPPDEVAAIGRWAAEHGIWVVTDEIYEHLTFGEQRAALAAVAGDLEAVATMRRAFEQRGSVMHSMLSAIPGVRCLEPQGAFYCFPSFADVLGRSIRGHTPATSLELCELILEEARVAIVPGEAFGAPGYARLSFALGDDDLVEGVSRIAALLA